MAGMAAVQAAYNSKPTVNDCEELAENDEELGPPTAWDAAFFASLSCKGGAQNLSEINPDRPAEFWKWYLPTVFHTFYENDKYSGWPCQ